MKSIMSVFRLRPEVLPPGPVAAEQARVEPGSVTVSGGELLLPSSSSSTESIWLSSGSSVSEEEAWLTAVLSSALTAPGGSTADAEPGVNTEVVSVFLATCAIFFSAYEM